MQVSQTARMQSGTFGELLEQFVSRYPSRAAAAEVLGIQSTTLGRWRSGATQEPSIRACAAIAREMGMSVGDVLALAYDLPPEELAPGPRREFAEVLERDVDLTPEGREVLQAVYRLARKLTHRDHADR